MPSPPLAPRFEILTTRDDFRRLQALWNPLLRISGNNSVFLTFEYLDTWLAVYGPGRTLRILAAWLGEELVGVAPFSIGPGPNRARRWLRYAGILGASGDELSEFLDFLIAPGHEEALTPRFLDFLLRDLRRDWDVASFGLAPSTSPRLPILMKRLHADGLPLRVVDAVPSPFLPLPASWYEVRQAKSRNFRSVWNRLHNKHRVEILEAGRDLDLDAAFDVLLRLNQSRWGSEGQAFTTEKTRRFHRMLAHRFHELGWLCFLLMKIDGEFAAVRFDYVYDGKLWNIQGGWNPALSQLSPGRILLGAQIQWCIRRDLREYDFLAGDADYKRTWATHERRLTKVEVFRPGSVRAQIFLRLRQLKERLKPSRREPAAVAELPNAPVSLT